MSAMPQTILIVEDEPLARMVAVAMIEDAGYLAMEADNADMAIGLLEAHSEIRLVFTDINMPGSMDGLKLANYAHGRWPPLRFIIVSGRQRPAGHHMPRGAHFHSKPYASNAIHQSLAALL